MNKRDFIQRCAVRALPTAENIQGFFAHVEWLWEQLTKAGYGAPAQAKPHAVKKHYDQLDDFQREWLDRFRDAFGKHYAPRERTALAWAKLDRMDVAQYTRIVKAARLEAEQRASRTTTPPYAELWLNERRFEDLVINERQAEAAERVQRKRQLTGELNHLLRLQKQVPEQAADHQPQIDKIRDQLEALQ